MKPDREKAVLAICRRYNTHPQFCGWEIPDRDRLWAGMDALLAEFEGNRPFGLQMTGEEDEVAAGKLLCKIAEMGNTGILKVMSPEAVAALRGVLKIAKRHVEIMSGLHRHWPEVPMGLSDWDLALYVLTTEAVHT